MGSGMSIDSGGFLSAAEIRDRLTAEFGPLLPILDKQPALPGGGPARYVGARFGHQVRRVGLIAAVSEPFCDTCNRVRLSASGQLHACLGYDEAMDLAAIVRSGPKAPRDFAHAVVAAVQTALLHKRSGHGFTQSGCGGPQKHMVSIGG
jgi:cyclic pyranopterin phosphate synthase